MMSCSFTNKAGQENLNLFINEDQELVNLKTRFMSDYIYLI